MDIKLLSEIERFCEQYYDEATLKHVHRVANYVAESPILYTAPHDTQDIAYVAALLHDIIEDNDNSKVQKQAIRFICRVGQSIYAPHVEQSIYAPVESKVLERLTKKASESYIDYIKRLHTPQDGTEAEVTDFIVAYAVKLADMKDHLMQKDTLTDKLKEKYWEALPYLL